MQHINCLVIIAVLCTDYISIAVSGKVGPVRPVNHISWAALGTQTDRPKSVRNR